MPACSRRKDMWKSKITYSPKTGSNDSILTTEQKLIIVHGT